MILTMKRPALLVVTVLLGMAFPEAGAQTPPPADAGATRYLAFQIFTGSFDSRQMRKSIPPLPRELAATVDSLVNEVGTVGLRSRKLAFIPGPLAFDHEDQDIRRLIRASFDLAIQKNVAVGFHVDDSMFWGRLTRLKAVENIEWLDWNRKPNTGRRLDWSATPTKIMPQLCFNSAQVKATVAERAGLIGGEVAQGLRKLANRGQEELFLGVIAGWETQIGKDFETGKSLGYCALTNRGFGPTHLPHNIDRERESIVREFVRWWTQSLAKAGVPKAKIYSHIAFTPRSLVGIAQRDHPRQFIGSYPTIINFAPPEVAFGESHRPGFSTYPAPGLLNEIFRELNNHGDPPWASSEGTAIDPSVAEKGGKGIAMEGYLGQLFNHGAQVVNIFGWAVGDRNNPFRKVAEGKDAIEAYRKFLRGARLAEAPLPQIPSEQFPKKARRIQAELPEYIRRHGSSRIGPLVEKLQGLVQKQLFQDAEKVADEILEIIDSARR